MQRLRSALLDAPSRQPSGLIGVGGIGKTALALAFAYREADAFPGGCWLLRCEGQTSLVTVIRSLVLDLGIELTDEEKLDDTLAVRRVLDLLRSRGDALFLLDNVDRPALLRPSELEIVRDEDWLRLIVTSRLAPADFVEAGAGIQPIDLDKLPENDALELMRHYQPNQSFASPESEAAAREIVHELDGLALAVETAAVYLGQNDPRVAGAPHRDRATAPGPVENRGDRRPTPAGRPAVIQRTRRMDSKPAVRTYPKTAGDWLILRSLPSKMCLSPSLQPSLQKVFG